MNFMPKIKKVITALQITKGLRYVIDTRQSWSKFDKPFKVYIISRMYTEAEYAWKFPKKYKENPFKEGQLYRKVAECESTKQHELLIYLVKVLKGGG